MERPAKLLLFKEKVILNSKIVFRIVWKGVLVGPCGKCSSHRKVETQTKEWFESIDKVDFSLAPMYGSTRLFEIV